MLQTIHGWLPKPEDIQLHNGVAKMPAIVTIGIGASGGEENPSILVARGGIEPPTRGFSEDCSTKLVLFYSAFQLCVKNCVK